MTPPEVPVMVSGYCPTSAVLPTVRTRALLPVVELGENAAVTPLGRPAMERATLLLKPYCG